MKTYCISIQKGGTGKTTTATALAHAASKKGYKVLAIDLDPQGQLSFSLSADTKGTAGAYQLINGVPPTHVIQHISDNLDIIPANAELQNLTTSKGSARRLEKALTPIRYNYDFCIIDTPPTAGELQYNALQASDGLIIPIESKLYSLQALYQMIDIAEAFRKSNEGLSIAGVVVTQYDGRRTIAKQMLENIRQTAEIRSIPFLGVVRAGAAVEEANTLQESLFDYAPKSKPAGDYLEVFDKLLNI